MSEIVFLRDAMMSREAFEQLPACVTGASGADVYRTAKSLGGKLCRALISRDGQQAWHAVALGYFNGTERALASRIIVSHGRYQSED
ncbi:hypothetical protein [Bradyrhizobium sp. BTAi1]|jgi:hypothetical protein|uniref:hypothetical protein n=1 Tax=Bradyrhizobium sp. (strain BTAi1 / ATCC BAA-1182) TaxID=288000 RepID=UPI00005DFB76|nr:hypothetical protein [Bradyrhizobium sp. BTAi1]